MEGGGRAVISNVQLVWGSVFSRTVGVTGGVDSDL